MAKKANPNQIDMFVNDTRSHKYSIVIHPDWTMSNKIKDLKHRLKDQIGRDPHDLYTPPHITLYECISNVCLDAEIINGVTKALDSFESFVINIGNPDYWDSGTFFFRIDEPKLIQRMALLIRQRIKPLKNNRIEGENGNIPHITISRFITKKEMSLITISEYEPKAGFHCKAVTILKKVEGEEHSEVLTKVKFI